MNFNRYRKLSSYRGDVLPFLLEDEVCNNLPVSILSDTAVKSTNDWLMSTVTDSLGQIVLFAFCTKPFNMILYAPPHIDPGSLDDALHLLAGELPRIRFRPPGVLARTELADSFIQLYSECVPHFDRIMHINPRSMIIMKLDRLQPYEDAPGACRVLTEADLSFVPLWEQAFCRECNVPSSPLKDIAERVRGRLGRDIHFIWEDGGVPVSQAVFGRETPNGAVVNWVYTPPEFRSRGYATSVVGELSGTLLSRGKEFCCLFADAANPVSRGIYSKLGYYDVCEFAEVEFKNF